MNRNEIHLEPGFYYHVFNRAVGNDKLFYSDENYRYFLKKYEEYLSQILDTYVYCLMPNHFHFLIRVKEENEIRQVLTNADKALSLHISRQFSNFFNGYSQAINKQLGRRGSLFSRAFKRKRIGTLDYLRNSVLYIHRNPVNHGFADSPDQRKYSSYSEIVSKKESMLKRKEVIAWFEDLGNLTAMHVDFERGKASEPRWTETEELI